MSPPLKVTTFLFLGLISNANIAFTEEAEIPSLELLEFLGNFESSDGEWIDPMTIEELANEQIKQQGDKETTDD